MVRLQTAEEPRMRWHVLRDLIKENNYKTFMEVGVFEGDTSRFLLNNIPDLIICGVDPYISTAKYMKDIDMNEVAEKLADVVTDSRFRLYTITSEEALDRFENNSFDIIFIDANHTLEHVYFDVRSWWKKVRVGGILAGHDYWEKRNKNRAVRKVVNQFVAEKKLKLNLDSDGIWYVKK